MRRPLSVRPAVRTGFMLCIATGRGARFFSVFPCADGRNAFVIYFTCFSRKIKLRRGKSRKNVRRFTLFATANTAVVLKKRYGI